VATNSPGINLESSNERVVAFFRVQQDAFRAISELKEAGFTSTEIGLMSKGKGSAADLDATAGDAAVEQDTDGDHPVGDHSESVWEKLKHFFGGESSEDADYRDSAAGMRWDEVRGDRYYRGLEQGGAVVTVTGPRVVEAREILQDAGADLHQQEEEFGAGAHNFASEEEGLDVVGTDVEETDEQDLDDEEIDSERARRDRDYRIQLHGEAFRSYRERLNNRGEGMPAQPLQEEPRLDELETSDDVRRDDSRNKLRNPAA
jgi:hypothetical protein